MTKGEAIKAVEGWLALAETRPAQEVPPVPAEALKRVLREAKASK